MSALILRVVLYFKFPFSFREMTSPFLYPEKIMYDKEDEIVERPQETARCII